MTSASKIKGSGYERQVAKFLTDTYNLQFIRNISGSGAYVGGKNSIRKQHLTEEQIRHSKGDIVPPPEFSKLNCEVKFYADFQFHSLCDVNLQLERWLEQLLTAGDVGDINILFYKINRRGAYIAVQNGYNWACNCSHVRYNSVTCGDWLIFTHENFFKYNTENLKNFCASIS